MIKLLKRFMHKTTLAPILLLLASCAQFDSEPPKPVPCYTPPKVESDFEKLFAFGVEMANMPVSARVEACESLLKRQKESPDTTLRLQILVGRSLSDACGDIHKILEQIDSISPENFVDQQLAQFVAMNREILKNMSKVSKKLGTLERKQKKFQTVLESKEASESKANEARLLREKLDAIRTMEKQLDESVESK